MRVQAWGGIMLRQVELCGAEAAPFRREQHRARTGGAFVDDEDRAFAHTDVVTLPSKGFQLSLE